MEKIHLQSGVICVDTLLERSTFNDMLEKIREGGNSFVTEKKEPLSNGHILNVAYIREKNGDTFTIASY